MITVKELLKACQEQVAKGNGDKGILLSRDDEGNSYHSCFYLFSEDVFEFTDPEEMQMPAEDLANCIILG
jgi:hypothetical protein